jgi:hypothetical protein
MWPNHGINLTVIWMTEKNHRNLQEEFPFSVPNLEPPKYNATLLTTGPQCVPLNP